MDYMALYDTILNLIRVSSIPTQVVVVYFIISVLGVVVFLTKTLLVAVSGVLGIHHDDDGLETLRDHHSVTRSITTSSVKTTTAAAKKKKKKKDREKEIVHDDDVTHRGSTDSHHGKGMSLKSLQKMSLRYSSSKQASSKRHDSELYVDTVKGHTDAVLGLSWATLSSGEVYLVTACKDRDMRVFSVDYSNSCSVRCIANCVVRTGIFDVYCWGVESENRQLCVAWMTHGPHATVEFHVGEIGLQHKKESLLRIVDIKAKIFAPKINFEPLCLVGSLQGGSVRCIAASTMPRVAMFDYNPTDTGIVHTLGSFDTNSMVNNDVSLSPDGSLFAVATFSPDVAVYTVSRGKSGQSYSQQKVASLVGHRKRVTSLCFSPCGTKMVTSSEDYTLRIWNLSTGRGDPKCIHTVGVPSQHPITRMSWRGDSIAAAAHCDVYIFDSCTGKVKHSIIKAHDAVIRCLEYSHVSDPFGTRQDTNLLAAGGDDSCVKLWRH